MPEWVRVRDAGFVADVDLAELDRGERDAIAIATAARARLLLMDEMAGRLAAARRGLEVQGTLGIVRDAHNAHLLDFDASIEKFRQFGFWASDAVIAKARAGLR